MEKQFEKKPSNESETIFRLREELKEAKEKIRKLEEDRHVDILTGLRTDAEPEMDKLIEELKEHRNGPLSSIVVVYLDLNKFKQINDIHGHAVGDKAILKFVDRLQSLIKRTDTIFRLHGDEFVVIMPVGKGLTEEETISIFQRLHNGVSKFDMPVDNGEEKIIELSSSIGFAVYKEGDNAETLMDKADKSMYENKEESRRRAS